MSPELPNFQRPQFFPDLIHSDDISESPKFSTLLGYTEEEITHYFGEKIAEYSVQKNTPETEVRLSMRQWYNGYRFSTNEIKSL